MGSGLGLLCCVGFGGLGSNWVALTPRKGRAEVRKSCAGRFLDGNPGTVCSKSVWKLEMEASPKSQSHTCPYKVLKGYSPLLRLPIIFLGIHPLPEGPFNTLCPLGGSSGRGMGYGFMPQDLRIWQLVWGSG